MSLRLVWMQIGILFGISELFFDSYHFLVVSLSAFIVAFLVRYGQAPGWVAFSIFCLLTGIGLVGLARRAQCQQKESGED